jgi:transcriptional regulator with XRE-family HTH domain
MPETTIHWRLRTAREARGLNQTQAAEALGVERASVSQWEKEPDETKNGKKGSTQPKRGRIGAIAQLYGVDPMWLLTGDGTPEGNMTPREWELLSIFRRLGPEDQETAATLVEALDRKRQRPIRGAS